MVLAHSIDRDIRLEKQYPPDLRNRVVGSRLQKEGKLPYTYFWQPADGIRYYDLNNTNFLGTGISNITASPFFHELLFPVCDLPQRTISRIWFCMEYMFLACIIGMITSMTTNRQKKWLIFNIGILFTLTEAWKSLILTGQLYFFLAFLTSCIFFLLYRNKKPGIFVAALLAVILVLARPITIVLYIPFLFNFKRNLFFMSVSFTAFALYGLFVLTSTWERSLYQNYFSGMKMQLTIHQNVAMWDEPPVHSQRAHIYTNLEGFDLVEANRQEKLYPIKVYSENGNLFFLYHKITHKKMPVAVLNGLSIFTIFFLTSFYFFHIRKYPAHILQILLFGFALYMIVEFFAPFFRHQYYTVQWLPIVLIGFLLTPGWKNIIFLLLAAGLLLNILNLPWLFMRHTIGEFSWLTATILLIFSKENLSANSNGFTSSNVQPWKQL